MRFPRECGKAARDLHAGSAVGLQTAGLWGRRPQMHSLLVAEKKSPLL